MLSPELQSRIDDLYVFLNVAIPERPGTEIDGFIPLIEHIKNGGGVFVIKWDGERSSRHCTVVVSHPEMDTFRVDEHVVETATAKAVLQFAETCLGFPESKR